MASAADNKFLLPEDMLYLATFTMGMAAFWLSGNITILVPAFKNSGLLSSSAGNLGFTAFIFGFGMFVVGFLITRKWFASLIASSIAIILGFAAAQSIIYLAVGRIHTKQDIGILNFVLYLLYGLIYVVGLTIARKIASRKS